LLGDNCLYEITRDERQRSCGILTQFLPEVKPLAEL
jgi:hypothetical protein